MDLTCGVLSDISAWKPHRRMLGIKEGVSVTPNEAILMGMGRGLDISIKSEAEDWGDIVWVPLGVCVGGRDESGKRWGVT